MALEQAWAVLKAARTAAAGQETETTFCKWCDELVRPGETCTCQRMSQSAGRWSHGMSDKERANAPGANRPDPWSEPDARGMVGGFKVKDRAKDWDEGSKWNKRYPPAW